MPVVPGTGKACHRSCGTEQVWHSVCVALFHIVWQVVLHWGERKTEVPEAQREITLFPPGRDQLLVRATPGS